MKIYTFECEYDLGINDEVFATEESLRKAVSEALSDCCVEDSLEELEDDGLFCVEVKEVR